MIDTPQELVSFTVALVHTGEGASLRPRLLILSAPSIEGADATKIAERWIQSVKSQTSFPAVSNLIDGTGFEVALPDPKPALVDKPAPMVRVNTEHPVFKAHPNTEEMLSQPIEVAHGPA